MIPHHPGAPLLKVCGVTSAADVTLLTESGADLVGLWHGVPGGHADLPLPEATALAAAVRAAGLEPVLVTFSRDVAMMSTALRLTGIRWVQLHAYQLPATVAALHAALPGSLTVVKVLHLESEACVEGPLIGAYERAGADVFLLDNVSDDGRVGSTGHQLDPSRALAIAELTRRPFLVAGGLSSDNHTDFSALAAHERFMGIDVDTAAREPGGRFAGAPIRSIARAWRTAGHFRIEAV